MIAAIAIATPGSIATAQSNKEQSTGEIVTQPVRDVGIEKTKIPPLLVKVSEDPYTTAGTGGCAQLASSIAALNDVIGPDFTSSPAQNKRNIAKVGGAAVVNSLIPFRGIVREVSGAGPAERRMNAAVDAGVARRGFLRGLQSARKCRR
ncbi:hypothetical protein G4G27_08320 [Sphingomonas sp. So64.6b]|uniref:hypothetical protein n=1 Tax=Sphingomonas sp. So64.6b TaxID=2997354 RepID=UPI001603A29E|nr:hypothetical protein [Sphingomonas sp. So64.6b]QNA86873.1 hypothetical protein G4G27_08320 [Sphingomonas sp. So64.6b]